VPTKLANAMRAPSYRAIAIAILKNDNNLYSLGFSQRESDLVRCIIEMNKEDDDDQLEMF
jgi:predicted phosphoadenosine phosphosulfate sulfurtransferase